MSRLPLGGKVLSECEANEGRSLLFYTFKFFDNEMPLITALCAELPPGGKPRNAAFKLFVSENKLPTLIFGNFLLKIFRKSKMGYA